MEVVAIDNVFVSHAFDQTALAAELPVQILYAVSQACLMVRSLEKRTDVDDLFADIGHHLMAYITVQLTQGLPHAFVRIQPPSAGVCHVISDEVAFERHDRTGPE